MQIWINNQYNNYNNSELINGLFILSIIFICMINNQIFLDFSSKLIKFNTLDNNFRNQILNKKMAQIKQKKNQNFLINFFAGGIAGIIAKTATAPIQRVKLILQTEHQNEKVKIKYKGIVDCFSRCIKQDGFISLWRGNGVNVIRYFPTQALNFAFKDFFNSKFNRSSKQQKMSFFISNTISGGLAGSASTLFVFPLDFARTRLGVDMGKTVDKREFKGLTDCLTKTFKKEGIVGLYRGFLVSVISIFIYRGLYFGTFDTGKQILLNQDSSIVLKFFWAQFSVIFSETLAYPGDTIKRKLMMQSNKLEKQYSGTIDCIKQTYAKGGINAFWKGSYSNILRSIGSSLCLVLYDEIQKGLHLISKE